MDTGGSSADLLASLRAAQLGDSFWMYQFKVLPCPHGYRHSWTQCPFAHAGETARRRCPKAYSYSPDICPNAKGKRPCGLSDACPYAHNTFEQWLHPNRYRTRLCYLGAQCRRPTCFFAHTVEELRHVPTDEREAAATALANSQVGLGAASLLSPELASLPPALLAPPPALSNNGGAMGVSAPMANLLQVAGASAQLNQGTIASLNALQVSRPDLFQPAEMLSAPLPTLSASGTHSPPVLPGSSTAANAGAGLSDANAASIASTMTNPAIAALRARLKSSPALKVTGPPSASQVQEIMDLPRHMPLPSNRGNNRGEGPNSGPLPTLGNGDGESISAPLPSMSGPIMPPSGLGYHALSGLGLHSNGGPASQNNLIVIGGNEMDDQDGYPSAPASKASINDSMDQVGQLTNLLSALRSNDSYAGGPSGSMHMDAHSGTDSPSAGHSGRRGPSPPPAQQQQQQHGAGGRHLSTTEWLAAAAQRQHHMLHSQQQQSQQQQQQQHAREGGSGAVAQQDESELEALLPLLQGILNQGLASGQLSLVDGQLQLTSKAAARGRAGSPATNTL